MVGKVFCLVMLWQNPARRDKPWNYMPPEFQRYTKLNLATGYLYGHVENVWGIPFPKRMEWKDCFLSELFQEQVSDYKLTTCWLIDWTTNVTTNKKIDYKLIDKTWLEADLMSGNDYKLVDRWTLFFFFFFWVTTTNWLATNKIHMSTKMTGWLQIVELIDWYECNKKIKIHMSNTTDQQVLKLTTKPDYNLIADHKVDWLTTKLTTIW